ncbi:MULTISPECIES: OmpA family protein [Bacteroides]|uniref:OmpA family protein n=1 Tax=Bacteroides TaxID=816 RepID=UPI00187927FC|nr:OmpA family protein [Bacteroides fragilis]MBE7400195.1 OmpA family protein [Bacteroides fragilis]
MTNRLGLKPNKWILLATLLLMIYNSHAQEQQTGREQFEKGNWFVSGGLGGEWLTKTPGNMYVGGKISGGVHLTPLSGFRATAEIGKNRMENNGEATQLSANLDYMLTLIGNNGFNRFNLSAILGAGFNYYDLGNDNPKYTRVNTLSGNFSIQASYNVNRKFSIFIEPGLKVLPKYYSKELNNKLYTQSNLTVGVAYTFKDKYRKNSKEGDRTLYTPVADLMEIKEKIGMLCEEMKQMKQELQERRKIMDGENLMIVPQKNALSIDIMFDEFSSFVSEEQGQKIDGIGEWMKDNDASIRIIAFSDNLTDKKADRELRSRRSEAIRKILIEKHHIAPERITESTPEAMGYENKTGCNAMIVYIPENKQ